MLTQQMIERVFLGEGTVWTQVWEGNHEFIPGQIEFDILLRHPIGNAESENRKYVSDARGAVQAADLNVEVPSKQMSHSYG